MPDSAFHESKGVGSNSFFSFFLRGDDSVFIKWKRWNQFYQYNISGRGDILKYKRLKQVGMISLQ